MKLFKEILEELKTVLSGQTLDALLPPLLFFLIHGRWGLMPAIILSLLLCGVLIFRRLNKGEKVIYALFGGGGILVSLVFVLVSGQAKDYLLPDLIGNGALVVGLGLSLILKRPLAALASHLTRGWDLAWFQRPDIYPAYREVTWLWLAYFLMRFVLQLIMYLRGQVWAYLWVNTILGMPMNILILTISYIYGIYRLKALKGPGIDEYRIGAKPPYRGTTRGF